MNSNKNITLTNSPSRRKFVWGFSIISAFTGIAAVTRSSFFGKKDTLLGKPEKKMIKMLTQDGKLVEIDESIINTNTQKISNAELQHWIKK